MRNAVDFVTAPDPAELQANDLDPLCYTGSGRPSQAWFDECRRLGVAPRAMIQETYSTRSQEGPAVGVLDCQFAESRSRQRGHDGSIAVAVSDGNGRDAWDASGYGRGWASVASMPFFPYGALGVTASFLEGAACPLLIVGEWVPETWGYGRLISQLVGAQAPLSTPHDLNTVHAPYWGEEDDMFTNEDRKTLGELHLYLTSGPTSTAGRVFDIQQKIDAALAGATGQGSGPTPGQRAAVEQAVALLRSNGIDESNAANVLSAAFG